MKTRRPFWRKGVLMNVEQCANDLKLIDAWEKEQIEAIGESANEKRARLVFELSQDPDKPKNWVSQLAEKWGKDRKTVYRLKKLGEELSPKYGGALTPHSKEGVTEQLKKSLGTDKVVSLTDEQGEVLRKQNALLCSEGEYDPIIFERLERVHANVLLISEDASSEFRKVIEIAVESFWSTVNDYFSKVQSKR